MIGKVNWRLRGLGWCVGGVEGGMELRNGRGCLWRFVWRELVIGRFGIEGWVLSVNLRMSLGCILSWLERVG